MKEKFKTTWKETTKLDESDRISCNSLLYFFPAWLALFLVRG